MPTVGVPRSDNDTISGTNTDGSAEAGTGAEAVVLALGVLGVMALLARVLFKRWYGSHSHNDASRPLLDNSECTSSNSGSSLSLSMTDFVTTDSERVSGREEKGNALEMTATDRSDTDAENGSVSQSDADPVAAARADMAFLSSSPAPTFIADAESNIVVWSVGMAKKTGIDPEPGSPVALLPFASQEARDRMLTFLRDHTRSVQVMNSAHSVELQILSGLTRGVAGEEKGGSMPRCLMHLRSKSQSQSQSKSQPRDHVLLSRTLVTKTELGDLVLVGQEMDLKLAGLIGSAAPGNDDTISDITSEN